MYEQPIHPKNLWPEQDPLTHEPVDEVHRDNIGRLLERGTYTPPAVAHPGVRYQGSATTAERLEQLKQLWDGWGEEAEVGSAEQGR